MFYEVGNLYENQLSLMYFIYIFRTLSNIVCCPLVQERVSIKIRTQNLLSLYNTSSFLS